MAPSSLPPNKKRKISANGDSRHIKQLEVELSQAVSTRVSLNSLVHLIDALQSASDAELTSKAAYALYRVFVLIVNDGRLAPGGDEDAKVVRAWIWERLNGYVDFLVGLLQDPEPVLRVGSSTVGLGEVLILP
jgi:U3 small nucleolar RNA-associated protein 19